MPRTSNHDVLAPKFAGVEKLTRRVCKKVTRGTACVYDDSVLHGHVVYQNAVTPSRQPRRAPHRPRPAVGKSQRRGTKQRRGAAGASATTSPANAAPASSNNSTSRNNDARISAESAQENTQDVNPGSTPTATINVTVQNPPDDPASHPLVIQELHGARDQDGQGGGLVDGIVNAAKFVKGACEKNGTLARLFQG